MNRQDYEMLSELYDQIYEQAVEDTVDYLEESNSNYELSKEDITNLYESGEINKYEMQELLERGGLARIGRGIKSGYENIVRPGTQAAKRKAGRARTQIDSSKAALKDIDKLPASIAGKAKKAQADRAANLTRSLNKRERLMNKAGKKIDSKRQRQLALAGTGAGGVLAGGAVGRGSEKKKGKIKAAELKNEIERLKDRGLWDRIRNK